jgi:hypothetical protein
MPKMTPRRFLADITQGVIVVIFFAAVWVGVGLFVDAAQAPDSLYIVEGSE